VCCVPIIAVLCSVTLCIPQIRIPYYSLSCSKLFSASAVVHVVDDDAFVWLRSKWSSILHAHRIMNKKVCYRRLHLTVDCALNVGRMMCMLSLHGHCLGTPDIPWWPWYIKSWKTLLVALPYVDVYNSFLNIGEIDEVSYISIGSWILNFINTFSATGELCCACEYSLCVMFPKVNYRNFKISVVWDTLPCSVIGGFLPGHVVSRARGR
jgi:hypothetical protein